MTRGGHGPVPVMDVGGTHVSGALFDPATCALVAGSRCRYELDASADRDGILSRLVACAAAIDSPTAAVWGIAVPGPFDYDAGIARYRDVGKFDALSGVDVGRALRDGIPTEPAGVRFLNDASAFGLGEITPDGAAAGLERVVGLTLGTGVGSVFLENGAIVEHRPDVPPEGRVDLLRIDGRPLEDTVSRRAITARYAHLCGAAEVDVAVIAQRADDGDTSARRVLTEAFRALGSAIRPCIESFGADIVVVGGSITSSWNLIGVPLQETLGPVRAVPARLGDDAALIGAGAYVVAGDGDGSRVGPLGTRP